MSSGGRAPQAQEGLSNAPSGSASPTAAGDPLLRPLAVRCGDTLSVGRIFQRAASDADGTPRALRDTGLVQPSQPRADAGRSPWVILIPILAGVVLTVAWLAWHDAPSKTPDEKPTVVDPTRLSRERTTAFIAAARSVQQDDPELALTLVRKAPSPALAASAFARHAGLLNGLHIAPDGRLLTAGRDHEAILWNADGSGSVRFRGHRGPVLDAVLSPDQARVLTASSDGTARLWKLSGEALAVLRGHVGAVRSARFSADGTRLLTVGLDGEARLWSASGEPLRVLRDAGTATLEAHFLAGGTYVVSRDDRGTLRVFDAVEQAGPRTAPIPAVAALRIPRKQESRSALLLVSDGRVVQFITMIPGHHAVRNLVGHAARVLDAVIAPETDTIATASLDGTARLWSADGTPLRVLKGHGLAVIRVRVNGSGERVLTLGADGSARLWNARGETLATLTGPAFRDLGYASDGQVIWAVPRDAPGLLLFDADGTPRADGFNPEPDAREAPRPRAAGTAVCAGCHRKEYDLWAGSNHARTFEPAVAGNLPPIVQKGGTVNHAPGTTTFERRDGEFVASTVGADGDVNDYPLGWIAGRRRIRMYVTEMPDGRLQVMPAMRAELPDQWFDYTHLLFGGDPDAVPVVKPGDDAFWTGAGRSWGARCARCHSSGAQPRLPTTEQPGPRATWRDIGVDCEACHGPGAEHAQAWARADTNAPLLKLGTLDRKSSIEACTTCHMEGDVVEGDYRLGQDLYEHLDPTLLLDEERIDARGRPLELIYHGVSFGISRCAQEGGLTCARCHQAHGGPHAALLGRPPTNHELCAECHVDLVRNVATHSHHDATGAGGSCVGCHMPRLVIERGHGIITDHSIGVPDPKARGKGFARDACSWCHQGDLGAPADVVQLTDDRIRTAYAGWWPEAQPAQPWMLAVAAARADRPEAGAALVKVLEDRTQYRLVRATAVRLLGRQAATHTEVLLHACGDADSLVRRNALRALATLRSEQADAALQDALDDPSRAVRVVAARTALEGWRRVQENAALLKAVLPVLSEDAQAVPNDEMRWFRLGAACDVAGDTAGAIRAYGNMVGLHPLAHYVNRRLEELRSERR